jgi:hypothetical protein
MTYAEGKSSRMRQAMYMQSRIGDYNEYTLTKTSERLDENWILRRSSTRSSESDHHPCRLRASNISDRLLGWRQRLIS